MAQRVSRKLTQNLFLASYCEIVSIALKAEQDSLRDALAFMVMRGAFSESSPENAIILEGKPADLHGKRRERERINLHPYHYAGNNPVKFTDPDGRQSGPTLDEWGQSMAEHGSPVTSLIGNIFSSMAGNTDGKQRANQQGAQLPALMAKASGQILLSGAEFMSKNGSKIALACYASGLVEIGGVVDGVTLASNIIIDVSNFINSGDGYELGEALLKDVGMSVAIGLKGKALRDHIRDTYSHLKLSENDIQQITNVYTTIEGMVTDKALSTIDN